VGITGHQRLEPPEAWQWVTAAVRAELAQMPPPLVGVTSLAIGADQVFAVLVLELGGAIHAVIPFADIERSFSPEDLPVYRDLIKHAEVEILRTPGSDEDAYLAAGRRVVDQTDTIIAVWNGEPAKGKGGTADIVAYARERGVPLIHVNPDTRTITHH
jgi:hypothetical protein